jgi:hypothetical protein
MEPIVEVLTSGRGTSVFVVEDVVKDEEIDASADDVTVNAAGLDGWVFGVEGAIDGKLARGPGISREEGGEDGVEFVREFDIASD